MHVSTHIAVDEEDNFQLINLFTIRILGIVTIFENAAHIYLTHTFIRLDLTISNVSNIVSLAKVLLCPRGHTKENPESNLGIFFLGFCRTTFYQSACKCSRLKQKNQENKDDGKGYNAFISI